MKVKIEEANQEAVSRIQKVRPELVDVSIAGEAILGHEEEPDSPVRARP